MKKKTYLSLSYNYILNKEEIIIMIFAINNYNQEKILKDYVNPLKKKMCLHDLLNNDNLSLFNKVHK